MTILAHTRSTQHREPAGKSNSDCWLMYRELIVFCLIVSSLMFASGFRLLSHRPRSKISILRIAGVSKNDVLGFIATGRVYRGFSTPPTSTNGAGDPSLVGQSSGKSKQQQLGELLDTYQVSPLTDETATASPKKVFQDTIAFPTHFMIKVVAENVPGFADDIVGTVLSCLGPQTTKVAHTTKETSGGKYVSVSIKPYFQSAEELYAVYDRVKQDKRVKFML